MSPASMGHELIKNIKAALMIRLPIFVL
jgi:hypothetical protein